MTDAIFGQWVEAHIAATGAEPVRLTELLWANRGAILDHWHATYAELSECTQRLFENGRVPKFPNEHPNALHAELKALRAERERSAKAETFPRRYYAPGHVEQCDCPNCNGGELLPSYAAALDRLHDYIRQHGSLTGGIGLPVPRGKW